MKDTYRVHAHSRSFISLFITELELSNIAEDKDDLKVEARLRPKIGTYYDLVLPPFNLQKATGL